MAILCPKCGGNQVQSVKMVYQNGVSTSLISGQSRGVAFGGDGNLYGTVNSFNGTNLSKTALAQRFTPPDVGHMERLNKKINESTMYLWISIAAIIFSIFVIVVLKADNAQLFFFAFFAFIGGVGGTIVYSIMLSTAKSEMNTARYNDERERKKLGEWNNSFTCFTCGNVFEIKDISENKSNKQVNGDIISNRSGQEIPKTYWSYTDSHTVEFVGVGNLFRFEYNTWILDGPLPRTFKLSKRGPSAKLKIRGLNGTEYISDFPPELKLIKEDNLIPTEVNNLEKAHSTTQPVPNLIDEISRLNDLKLSGAISLEEYEVLKKRLLILSV